MIVLAAKLAPIYSTSVSPIVGGLAMGGAQALSMLISRKTIVGAKALASQVSMLTPSAKMQEFGTLTSLVGGATMVSGAALARGGGGGSEWAWS